MISIFTNIFKAYFFNAHDYFFGARQIIPCVFNPFSFFFCFRDLNSHFSVYARVQWPLSILHFGRIAILSLF